MSIVSYAQNFEDVMLWRALGHVKEGFYIDVGAQHPIVDSVSKAFYENGWRGVHVEATPVYADLLRQDRPDETVLQVALSASHGILKFYEIPETGLSTGDAQIADRHREQGRIVRELTVPRVTLADVFAQVGSREIHWLKVDVEGMEQEVVASWAEAQSRPWIVVVESTLPNTQIETHQEWEALLLGRGYGFVYFDGLNRFYVAEKYAHLADAFRAGPNVFDGFSLSGTAQTPFCSLINSRAAQQRETQEEVILGLERERAEDQQRAEECEQRLTLQVEVEEKERQRLVDRLAVERGAHETLERAFADLVTQTGEKARIVQEELLREQVRREREFGQQLVDARQQVEQEKNEQICRLRIEHDEREKIWISLESQARVKSENIQQDSVEREKNFAGQLIRVIDTASREKAELEALYRQQERTLHVVLAARERAVGDQLLAAQKMAREAEWKLSEREAVMSKELELVRKQSDREKLEIESAFKLAEENLIKDHSLHVNSIKQDLLLAEQTLATAVRVNEKRDTESRREAAIYIEQIEKLRNLLVENEKYRLHRSGPIWRKMSPISLNVAVVARIYDLVSMLDVEPTATSGLQGIDMNSRVIAQASYQPVFKMNKDGIYSLDDFSSLYDRNFVQAAYLAILRREPDMDGERHYLAKVRAGIGKDEILDDILKSKEAKQYKTLIHGLSAASIVRKICRIPLFGQIFIVTLFLLDIKNHLQDLRALENHVIRIAEDSQIRSREKTKATDDGKK